MNANSNSNKKIILHSALLVALSLVGSQTVSAAPKMAELPNGWEACGGVARAGMNDCAIKTSLHACVGMAKKDHEPDSYVFMPKGLCTKMANGNVLAITKADFAEMKEKMKMMKEKKM